MPTIADIIASIEETAPLYLQESYDNSGLQIGDRRAEATGALLCTDVTERTVDEAIQRGCNLIISHHPLLFHGLKRIAGDNFTQRIVAKAIKNDIAIYSSHTAMDNAWGGVSHLIASKLGISDIQTLQPQADKLMCLSVFTPENCADTVAAALFDAGAGRFGNYDCCGFSANGTGTFRALQGANPYVGEKGKIHHEKEVRQEFLIESASCGKIVRTLIAAHPYEEPAFNLIPLANKSKYSGSGVVGNITPTSLYDFLSKVKKVFDVHCIRYSEAPSDKTISRVALCGGSGSFLTHEAIDSGADLYLTGDFKYHDFQTYAEDIIIADFGHYESEHLTKEIFSAKIQEKFPNFATYYSDTEKNPIIYL